MHDFILETSPIHLKLLTNINQEENPTLNGSKIY